MKKLLLPLMAPILIWSSCSVEEPLDSEKPLILEITINGEDAHHSGHAHEHEFFNVNTDSTALIGWEVSDNMELSELRMDIHPNFDGHGHGKKAEYDPFGWERIIPLSGKLQSGTESMQVPENVLAGPYHLDFLLLDKTGNISESVLIELFLLHPSQPTFNLLTPVEPIAFTKGSTFELSATVEDDEDLELVMIELLPHDGGEHLFEKEIGLKTQVETSYELKELISIPNSVEAGEYELKFIIKDHDGHMTIMEYEMTIN